MIIAIKKKTQKNATITVIMQQPRIFLSLTFTCIFSQWKFEGCLACLNSISSSMNVILPIVYNASWPSSCINVTYTSLGRTISSKLSFLTFVISCSIFSASLKSAFFRAIALFYSRFMIQLLSNMNSMSAILQISLESSSRSSSSSAYFFSCCSIYFHRLRMKVIVGL